MIAAKQRKHFLVSFTSEHPRDLELLQAIEPTVLAVDLGTEVFTPGSKGSGHRTNTVIVWLADDVESKAMTAIRAIIENGNQAFSLSVKLFRAKEVFEIFTFDHCVLTALQHSIFTKEDHSEPFSLKSSDSELSFTGSIAQPSSRECSAKLLQIGFATMNHHIISSLQ